MNLNRVTITGADDTTDIKELVALSKQFPFVEWGILVSANHYGAGHPRFPSREWCTELRNTWELARDMQLSTHVCGKWVRNLLVGELTWSDLPPVIQRSKRVQINTHGSALTSTLKMVENLLVFPHRQFIFQWDGVNDHLTHAMRAYGIDAVPLFDKSGGLGILPKSWPVGSRDFTCGYAGGLGPKNLIEQLMLIEPQTRWPQPFWIDMERNVRTADDQSLDMHKVRLVLEQTARLVTL